MNHIGGHVTTFLHHSHLWEWNTDWNPPSISKTENDNLDYNRHLKNIYRM